MKKNKQIPTLQKSSYTGYDRQTHEWQVGRKTGEVLPRYRLFCHGARRHVGRQSDGQVERPKRQERREVAEEGWRH